MECLYVNFYTNPNPALPTGKTNPPPVEKPGKKRNAGGTLPLKLNWGEKPQVISTPNKVILGGREVLEHRALQGKTTPKNERLLGDPEKITPIWNLEKK